MQENHELNDPQQRESTSIQVAVDPVPPSSFPGTEAIEAPAPMESPELAATHESSWLEKRKMRRLARQEESAPSTRWRLPWDLRIKIAVVASFVILVTALVMNRGAKSKPTTPLPLAKLGSSSPKTEASAALDKKETQPLTGGQVRDADEISPPPLPEPRDDRPTFAAKSNEEPADPLPPTIKTRQEEPTFDEVQPAITISEAPPSLDLGKIQDVAATPPLSPPPEIRLAPPAPLEQPASPKLVTDDPPSMTEPVGLTPKIEISSPQLPEAAPKIESSAAVVATPVPVEQDAPKEPSEVASGPEELPANEPPVAEAQPAPEEASPPPIANLSPPETTIVPPAESNTPPPEPVAIKTPELATPPPAEPSEFAPLYEIPNAGVKAPGDVATSKLPIESPRPATAASSQPRTLATDIEPIAHVVRSGENFWTIARYHYGSGRFYKALWFANRDQAEAPEDLYVGTVIRVPPVESLDRSQIEPVPGGRDTSRIASGKPSSVQDSRTKRVSNSEAEGLIMLPTADPAHGVVENMPPPTSSSRAGKTLGLPTRSRVVKKHETLRSIARDELGQSEREAEILALNPELIAADDGVVRLRPGMTLKLPDDTRRR